MHTIQLVKPLEAFTLDVDVKLTRRVTGLFGPSGSGKTTLLNGIAGLVAPQRGRIRIGGELLYERDGGEPARNVPARRRRIGYVFQDPLLFEHMSVERNLRYARRAGDGPGFAQVVEVLELGALLTRRACELSGGEKRRVALGRALLSAPRLLLLDEPLTGLDRRLAGKTLSYIRAVLDAFAVPAIYVSHQVSDVMYLCDEVVVIERGRVVVQGVPAELIARMEASGPGRPPALKNLCTLPVRARDPSADTVVCALGTQKLVAMGRVPENAQRATVLIPARDIILASSAPAGLSARNILRGRVQRVESVAGHAVVFVDVGVEWMVEVTSAAVRELALTPGAEVHVIVKASTVQIVDAPAGDSRA